MKSKLYTKTLKVRIKDNHARILRKMSCMVNRVWNMCNEFSIKEIQENKKYPSGYDMQALTKGKSKLFGLNSATMQMVCHEYATRRKQFKKNKLAWRKSNGVRKSLGWIPIRKDCCKLKDGKLIYNGKKFTFYDSYNLSKYKFRQSSFNQDSRGRWYFNVVVEYLPIKSKGFASIGIDLGLKTIATCSDGTKLEAVQLYRKSQEKLATAQRAKNKHRVKSIHAKVKNQRQDILHKFSNDIVKKSSAVFVGNVKSSQLAKTKMAKSVLDAGWSMLKTMLEYKCDHAGIVYQEIDERYTTQVCSCCGCIGDNSPKGRAGLRIREWACTGCGAKHDRDINASKNILASGLRGLAGGIPHYSTCA